jgi:hypothetical protein
MSTLLRVAPDEQTVVPRGFGSPSKPADSPVMAPCAQPQAGDSTRWSFRALDNVLPGGLPVGALTCLVLPARGGIRGGPWSTLVGQLLLDTVDRCQPVVYTYASAQSVYGPEDGENPLGPHYFGILDSRPVRSRFDRSIIPGQRDDALASEENTLMSLQIGLTEHEHRYGPALAILDNLEQAQPYAGRLYDLCHQAPETTPSALPSTAEAVAAQRADDLRRFAESCPLAPTVVAWSPSRWEPAPQALFDVARVVITADYSPRWQPVPISLAARGSLSAELPPPVRTVLPRFDWGFDDQDLGDDEDA